MTRTREEERGEGRENDREEREKALLNGKEKELRTK